MKFEHLQKIITLQQELIHNQHILNRTKHDPHSTEIRITAKLEKDRLTNDINERLEKMNMILSTQEIALVDNYVKQHHLLHEISQLELTIETLVNIYKTSFAIKKLVFEKTIMKKELVEVEGYIEQLEYDLPDQKEDLSEVAAIRIVQEELEDSK